MIIILGGEQEQEQKKAEEKKDPKPSGGSCSSEACKCEGQCDCAPGEPANGCGCQGKCDCTEPAEDEKCDCSDTGPTASTANNPISVGPFSFWKNSAGRTLMGGDQSSWYDDPLFWMILVVFTMVIIYIIMELRSIRLALEIGKVVGGYRRYRY